MVKRPVKGEGGGQIGGGGGQGFLALITLRKQPRLGKVMRANFCKIHCFKVAFVVNVCLSAFSFSMFLSPLTTAPVTAPLALDAVTENTCHARNLRVTSTRKKHDEKENSNERNKMCAQSTKPCGETH